MTTRIYSWNVNGIRAVIRKGDFASFLATHQPDVLCLQETKASQDQVDIDFSAYEEYWQSAEKKGYSGTAIFTKVSPHAVHQISLSSSPPHGQLADAYGDARNEGRLTVLEFSTYIVISVYTPNAKDDLSRLPLRHNFDVALLTFMKQLERKKPVILCGDLNVAHTELDLARPRENVGKKGFTEIERAGFTAYIEAGFVDTFRIFNKDAGHYTWWSNFGAARARNIGWRIDYILGSQSLAPYVTKAEIHDAVMGSDHCPVSIELALDL